MKQSRIFIYIISFFLFGKISAVFAQDAPEEIPPPPAVEEAYGFRFGLDLSKPLRSLLDENYSGFELMADYRIRENWYAAGEIGFDEFIYVENNMEGSTTGSYAKLGVNFNAYENWTGMQNEIYVGLRYGFSTFSQNLDQYEVYTHPYFPPDVREASAEFDNLTASWGELILGVKAEVLNNLFLGFHFQLKRRITATEPTNFDNLYIPGFHRTYDGSEIGVGYGYTVTYLIPFYKK